MLQLVYPSLLFVLFGWEASVHLCSEIKQSGKYYESHLLRFLKTNHSKLHKTIFENKYTERNYQIDLSKKLFSNSKIFQFYSVSRPKIQKIFSPLFITAIFLLQIKTLQQRHISDYYIRYLFVQK